MLHDVTAYRSASHVLLDCLHLDDYAHLRPVIYPWLERCREENPSWFVLRVDYGPVEFVPSREVPPNLLVYHGGNVQATWDERHKQAIRGHVHRDLIEWFAYEGGGVRDIGEVEAFGLLDRKASGG
jgi:hypothetical protein